MKKNKIKLKWATACCRNCVHLNGISLCDRHDTSVDYMNVCELHRYRKIEMYKGNKKWNKQMEHT